MVYVTGTVAPSLVDNYYGYSLWGTGSGAVLSGVNADKNVTYQDAWIDMNGDVTMNNISIVDCDVVKNGDSVYVGGVLTMTSTGTLRITNNRGKVYGYRGVVLEAPTIVISGGGVGAQWNYDYKGVKVTATNSLQMTGNSAAYSGGYPYLYYMLRGQYVNVKAPTITFNGSNGAMSARDTLVVNAAKNITLSGTGFLTVSGQNSGEAATIDAGGDITITAGGDFVARGTNQRFDASGVIYSYGGNVALTAKSITFDRNSSAFAGAAVRAKNDISLTATGGSVVVTNHAVNNDGSHGGAINAWDNVTIWAKNAVQFVNNYINGDYTAMYGGGAIYSEGDVTVKAGTDIVFSDSRLPNGVGGALYAYNFKMEAQNVTMNNNTIGTSSGAPLNSKASGGAICTQWDSDDYGNVTITVDNAATFKNNSVSANSDVYGGAISANLAFDLTAKTAVFDSNAADSVSYSDAGGGAWGGSAWNWNDPKN